MESHPCEKFFYAMLPFNGTAVLDRRGIFDQLTSHITKASNYSCIKWWYAKCQSPVHSQEQLKISIKSTCSMTYTGIEREIREITDKSVPGGFLSTIPSFPLIRTTFEQIQLQNSAFKLNSWIKAQDKFWEHKAAQASWGEGRRAWRKEGEISHKIWSTASLRNRERGEDGLCYRGGYIHTLNHKAVRFLTPSITCFLQSFHGTLSPGWNFVSATRLWIQCYKPFFPHARGTGQHCVPLSPAGDVPRRGM